MKTIIPIMTEKQSRWLWIAITAVTAITVAYCLYCLYRSASWYYNLTRIDLPHSVCHTMQEVMLQAHFWMAITFVTHSCVLWLALYHFRTTHLHQASAETHGHRPAGDFAGLEVNVYQNTVTCNGNSYKTRKQITALLVHLMQTPGHTLAYEELNSLIEAHFLDGSPNARKKVNNLKYELNNVLRDTPFCIVCPKPDTLALMHKEGANQATAHASREEVGTPT